MMATTTRQLITRARNLLSHPPHWSEGETNFDNRSRVIKELTHLLDDNVEFVDLSMVKDAERYRALRDISNQFTIMHGINVSDCYMMTYVGEDLDAKVDEMILLNTPLLLPQEEL